MFLPGLAEITKMLEELAGNPLFNDKVKQTNKQNVCGFFAGQRFAKFNKRKGIGSEEAVQQQPCA